jgi:hypothetical protein
LAAPQNQLPVSSFLESSAVTTNRGVFRVVLLDEELPLWT